MGNEGVNESVMLSFLRKQTEQFYFNITVFHCLHRSCRQ